MLGREPQRAAASSIARPRVREAERALAWLDQPELAPDRQRRLRWRPGRGSSSRSRARSPATRASS